MEWGHRKVENNAKFGLPAVALKEIVALPLKAVRLGLISVRDLNSVVRKDGLADPDDLMDALLYHSDNLSVDLSDVKFHPRVGRFEHDLAVSTALLK